MNKLPWAPYQKQLLMALARQAPHYQKASSLIAEIGRRLLSRLTYFRVPPENILDLGCGQCIDTQLLQEAYRHAKIIGIDFSLPQLQHSAAQLRSHTLLCVANAHQLPLPPTQFDLVFANLLMPAIIDYQTFWQECRRVLKPGGILLFSSLGPDTLTELRASAQASLENDIVNHFPNAADLGSGLLSAGFVDPAVEVEHITLRYSSLKKLLTELKYLGSIKIWHNYTHVYKKELFWQTIDAYYRKHFSSGEKLIATAEFHYAIAFAPTDQTERRAEISVKDIKRRQ